MMAKNERILIVLLATLNFTHILDFMIMMPLGAHLISYFKIEGQFFSHILASYSISACVASITASFFVDRFDRKNVLLFGYGGFLIGTLLCGLAPTPWFLLIARIIAGLFGGLIGAQVLSIVADVIPFERRATAMGYLMTAFSVASVIGIPFALFLADHFSWHAPFILVAGLGVLLFPMLLRFIPSVTGHIHAKDTRPGFKENVQLVFSGVKQRNALLFAALLMFGHFLIVPFLTPFLEFNVGFERSQIKYVYIVGGLITLFSGPRIGKLADGYGKRLLFTWCGILSLIPVLIITNLPHWNILIVLCITGVWFMLANGRNIASAAIVSNVVPPEHRGSFMSINSAVQQMSSGLASIAAGLLVTVPTGQPVISYARTGMLSVLIIIGAILLSRRLPAD